jgi:exopolysaccharide production protein ExoY
MRDAYATGELVLHALPRGTSFDGIRVLDLLISSAGLVLASPLLVGIYALLKLEGEDPLFSHERVGRGGRIFQCLKFRTMVPNADRILAKVLAEDPVLREEWSLNQKLRDDPRVTRLGAFLRRTSLDELPQLINILKGEMSLVGPRPVVPEELVRYGSDAGYYLAVRPGLTGPWQISGRNGISYETRIRMDVEYVKSKSLLVDLKILFKTIPAVAIARGAY